MNTEMVNVTPQLAQEWLDKNIGNRKLNKRRVDAYTKEMKEGKWKQSHQGIAFYKDGGFADGQHRLAAIVKSGAVICMPVTWGVPRESAIAIDTHQIRGTNQSIAISGVAPWIGKNEVAITKFLIRVYNQGVPSFSTQSIVECAEKHKDIIVFGSDCFSSTRPGITNAVIRASIGVCSKFLGENDMQRFADIMLSGMPESPNDKAAIIMREYLIKNSKITSTGEGARKNTAIKLMRSAISFQKGEQISRVSNSEKLPFIIDI